MRRLLSLFLEFLAVIIVVHIVISWISWKRMPHALILYIGAWFWSGGNVEEEDEAFNGSQIRFWYDSGVYVA